MVRTALTPQVAVDTGLNLSLSAANTDGHSFKADPRCVLVVANASGGAVTVTVPTSDTVRGLAIEDRTVSVPASQTRYIGPFGDHYTEDATGDVNINFSAVASVTCALLRVP